ncbi:hypothetical protein [Sodalis praecaptivus]|uniref:hypothetical protein n=1 Tax=Sodalis TaxID=84565 RepID=UPI0011DCD350|nr:hypothetical protein [Sodalis praecaptivus]
MNYELTIYAIDNVSAKPNQLALNFHSQTVGSKAIPATTVNEPLQKHTFASKELSSRHVCELKLVRTGSLEGVLAGTITLYFDPDSKEITIQDISVPIENGKQLTAELEGKQTIKFTHSLQFV